ncbi:MAG: hydrogenase maturation protease [Candidatus Omnitrophica bacterium]|nr:hydrogenase maturation protease [Candidatus Omnitrophota bacterium]
MLSKEVKTFLVMGIGNPLRSDDGVGPYIAQKIKEKAIAGVKVLVSQQLDIEVLEEAANYNKILIIDASFLGEGLIFRKIQSTDNEQGSSSHHLTPEFFWTLAKKLYHHDLSLYLCAIRGRNFEMGEQLSPEIQLLVPKAMDEICAFLKEK